MPTSNYGRCDLRSASGISYRLCNPSRYHVCTAVFNQSGRDASADRFSGIDNRLTIGADGRFSTSLEAAMGGGRGGGAAVMGGRGSKCPLVVVGVGGGVFRSTSNSMHDEQPQCKCRTPSYKFTLKRANALSTTRPAIMASEANCPGSITLCFDYIRCV